MAKSTGIRYKSDFILENPDLPAKEIVAKGKALGLGLTEKYVYTIRSVARSRKQRDEERARGGGGAAGSGPSSAAGALLLAVAGEIGLGRAIEVLQEQRRRVVAMLPR
ncbi:MAG: hypothetical protein HY825_19060 [Acidobacteria bacterium]|nr:hypothetical protein [Acidobacteriota bacterium]